MLTGSEDGSWMFISRTRVTRDDNVKIKKSTNQANVCSLRICMEAGVDANRVDAGEFGEDG